MSTLLTAADLRRVAGFLDALEAATSNTGVVGTYYGEAGLKIDDETLKVEYDDDKGVYVVEVQ